MIKKRYSIEGMTCSACKAHVEKAINEIAMECNVNLINNYADVLYDNHLYNDEDIINKVISAGYKAYLYKSSEKVKEKGLIKILTSVFVLIVLMYFSMWKMLNLPYPNILKANSNIIGIYICLILSIVILILNFRFYSSGFKKLIKLKPNMDSLIFIGSLSSYIYAIVNLIFMTCYVINNNTHMADHYSMNMYFESGSMILVFVSIGKYLEGLSKKQTSKAIEELIQMIPKTVLKKVNDEFEMANIEDVKVGDILMLKPHDFIAIDGIIIEGEGLFDESSITGESVFVHKQINDEIISGSINQGGVIIYKALKESNESTISRVVQMVEDASNSKMPLARLADKVSLYFVPVIIGIAIISFVVWMILMRDFSLAFDNSISVLVISCPCALGLATPLCIMISTGIGAKNNILIKSAETLETLYKIDTVVVDKTGTITEGHLTITDVFEFEKDSLKILEALENGVTHPFSKAFNKSELEITNINNVLGLGINGIYKNKTYYAGGLKYLNELGVENTFKNYDELINEGKNVIFLFDEKDILLAVALKDRIKESSIKAIEAFKRSNVNVIMASGDVSSIVEKISNEVGIDEFYSSCMPSDKTNIIDELHNKNKKVLMIGDGINDAIALSKADVSIAVDSKVSISSNAADVILAKGDLIDAYNAYYLSKKTIKNIKINLFWALIYNAICIPIAFGALYIPFGIKMSPMIGSLCMSLSSLCICLNALRLKTIKMEESLNMKMSFYVDDMMCGKCEAHVKEALSVEGVSGIKINLKKKIVSVETELSKEEIYKLVKNAGYEPTDK